MRIKLAVSISVLTALSGCATTGGGTGQLAPFEPEQAIYIATINGNGTQIPGECTLSNDKGSWTVKTPDSVMVPRSTAHLIVDCQSPGLKNGNVTAVPRHPAGRVVEKHDGTTYNYPDSLRIMMGRGTLIDRWDQESAEMRTKK